MITMEEYYDVVTKLREKKSCFIFRIIKLKIAELKIILQGALTVNVSIISREKRRLCRSRGEQKYLLMIS